jgi:hypothetical protein
MGGMENSTLVEVQPDQLSSSYARRHIEYYSPAANLTPLDIRRRAALKTGYNFLVKFVFAY